MLKGSWKTTAAGIAAIVVLLGNAAVALLDGDTATNVDWSSLFAGVSAGLIGIFARDNNKSSEEVGVK